MTYYSIFQEEYHALIARLEQEYWEKKIEKLDRTPAKKLVKEIKL